MTPLRNATGAIDRLLNVAFDVTDEVARAAQAARDEKLRALGQMAGGIAHDLNQSLTLVAGYGELARESLNCDDAASHAACDMIRIMERAAYDGGETVKRLLTFARGARDEAPEQPVDVEGLLHEIVQLTAPRWRDHVQATGRRITLHCDAAPGVALAGSHSALREALTNLVFNAVDAMPHGGTITLSARQLDGRVMIDVTDTGTGMSPDVMTRVFEPFFTTKGDAGTGLGLAMVFGIVQRHHGQVDITSEVGRGTTFHLTFPALDLAALGETSPDTPEASDQYRVLIVDDEPNLARLLAAMLRRDRHVVTTATSAEAALQMLETEVFDVVISDLSMGSGLNGWELAAAIAESNHPIPVILATGWGSGISEDEALARKVSGVMAKPYRGADVRDILLRVLGAQADSNARNRDEAVS